MQPPEETALLILDEPLKLMGIEGKPTGDDRTVRCGFCFIQATDESNRTFIIQRFAYCLELTCLL